ncbi:hypothetical protein [Lutimonas vermicola]|uniref:Uncharacterized protein n=1 Tax=Lutimonas vermicola TaxID=414288 RepID=A0ABU9L1F2_9FLAO
MPGFKYSVDLLELKEIQDMTEAWTFDDFFGLLSYMEYDDAASVPQNELKEMVCLALSDFETEDAAIKILEFRLEEKLNKGQRQNLAEELKEDRLWEEYSDITLHEELFNVACLLYWTFPKHFSTPDMVRLKVRIVSLNKESKNNLIHPTPSFLARILNDGMDNSNIMYRLFGDNITSNSFPESEHIIWKFEESGFSEEENSNTFIIYTSWNWVRKLKGVEEYESLAFSDQKI